MTKQGVDKALIKVLSQSSRPLCTKELSDQLKISWHTFHNDYGQFFVDQYSRFFFFL